MLTKTDNEAALRVLVPALDSPTPSIQLGALRALLRRRSSIGHQEILRRLHYMPEQWKPIIAENRGRMLRTLRDGVLGSDVQRCENACRAAVWFREYDLMPTLLNALGERDQQRREMLAKTILELTTALHDELARGDSDRKRRDPQLVRAHTITALERSIEQFLVHERLEVAESFLLLVNRENPILGRVLASRHHAAFQPIMEILRRSEQSGVIRLLLSFLEDTHVPVPVLKVVAERDDLRFVQALLRKVGRAPSKAVAQNLKRIDTISWLRAGPAFFEQLDDASQHGVVRLVMASGLPRLQVYNTIEYLLLRGKPGGRREAAEALDHFNGAEANALALRALDDRDPRVQSTIIPQLRRRGIPGVLSRMVGLVDSPHAMVRKAARECLSEFTFERYLGAFDMLDEEVRQSTGQLVRKIDPRAISQLTRELQSPSRNQRLRGLAVARAMDLVEPVEDEVVELLGDGDHLIRAEAAATLAVSSSMRSGLALDHALRDTHPSVRAAAQQSLGQREDFSNWRAEFNDPRD